MSPAGESAFTLIDLLVTIAIIGILAAIAVPAYLDQRTKAQNAMVQSDLRNAAQAEEAYHVENNIYINNGSYLESYGYRPSKDVEIFYQRADSSEFCLSAKYATGGFGCNGNTWWYISNKSGDIPHPYYDC